MIAAAGLSLRINLKWILQIELQFRPETLRSIIVASIYHIRNWEQIQPSNNKNYYSRFTTIWNDECVFWVHKYSIFFQQQF